MPEQNVEWTPDAVSIRHCLKELVDLLNDGLKVDQNAVSGMMNHRSYCTDALIAHPTIMCVTENCQDGLRKTVGILGILNGWARPLGWRIEAIMAGPEALVGLGDIIGFRLMPAEA